MVVYWRTEEKTVHAQFCANRQGIGALTYAIRQAMTTNPRAAKKLAGTVDNPAFVRVEDNIYFHRESEQLFGLGATEQAARDAFNKYLWHLEELKLSNFVYQCTGKPPNVQDMPKIVIDSLYDASLYTKPWTGLHINEVM